MGEIQMFTTPITNFKLIGRILIVLHLRMLLNVLTCKEKYFEVGAHQK